MSLFTHRRTSSSMKRFYNWFSSFYKNMDKPLSRIIKAAIVDHFDSSDGIDKKSALEYACGTGSLTVNISPLFKNIRARDLSPGMLEQAKARAKDCCSNVEFLEGSLFDITEEENSFDYVFISFALHLFSPLEQEEILGNLINVAREKVFVIDHVRKWQPLTALAEWMEGSYYDKFIHTDFQKMSERLGVKSFYEDKRKDCTVLVFTP